MKTALIHTGIITAVRGSKARVRLVRGEESCASCAAKSLCAPGRGEEVVVSTDGYKLNVGEEVELLVSDRSHRLAVLTMLVIPWSALAGTLALLLAFTNVAEGIAVGAAFCVMILCYVAAALLRPRIARELNFRLRPLVPSAEQ